jgi:murein DD-endopeptidase MepM/ murein hydrolase activator NlpD
MFPIPFVPTWSYTGPRGWNADRSAVAKQLNIPGGVLKHAACDLIAPPGTPVLAVASGFVRENPKSFYPLKGPLITYAFSIQHPGFTARYCEIGQAVEVKEGDYVLEGQVIGYIGHQPGDGDHQMLHFEMYRGNLFGDLSNRSADHAPFFRRKDVFDPTPHLDKWKPTAVWKQTKTWKFKPRDAEGRLFLQDA